MACRLQLFWYMRNTDKLEMILSLALVVGFIASLAGFNPLTKETVAAAIDGMPVMAGQRIDYSNTDLKNIVCINTAHLDLETCTN